MLLISKLYYKTLGTSLINSPLSPLSLHKYSQDVEIKLTGTIVYVDFKVLNKVVVSAILPTQRVLLSIETL